MVQEWADSGSSHFPFVCQPFKIHLHLSVCATVWFFLSTVCFSPGSFSSYLSSLFAFIHPAFSLLTTTFFIPVPLWLFYLCHSFCVVYLRFIQTSAHPAVSPSVSVLFSISISPHLCLLNTSAFTFILSLSFHPCLPASLSVFIYSARL